MKNIILTRYGLILNGKRVKLCEDCSNEYISLKAKRCPECKELDLKEKRKEYRKEDYHKEGVTKWKDNLTPEKKEELRKKYNKNRREKYANDIEYRMKRLKANWKWIDKLKETNHEKYEQIISYRNRAIKSKCMHNNLQSSLYNKMIKGCVFQ